MTPHSNQLSKLYQRWLPWLSEFDNKLQPIMQTLLSQLDRLLGPIEDNDFAMQTQQAGLGEIKPGGLYQNLLLSEWLLIDEELDEFMRRAVAHEHLFLAPTPEDEKSSKVIIALIDTGILQLGRQRIIHLVMMLLLARRAKQQNGLFYWGSLEHPTELKLFNGIQSLLELLRIKHIGSVCHEHIEYWQTYCNSFKNLDECWFIGAEMSASYLNFPTLFSHFLYIKETVAAQNQLTATSVNQNRTKKTILTLPNQIVCSKILSGQLAVNSNYGMIAHHCVVTINSNFVPVISMTANQIVTLTDEGKHTVFCSVSNMLSVKQKYQVSYQNINGQLLALDFQHKRVIGLVNHAQKVAIWQPNKPSETIDINLDDLAFTSPQHFNVFLWLYDNHQKHIYLIDKHRELWKYPQGLATSETATIGFKVESQVIGLFKLDEGRFFYAKYHENCSLKLKSFQLGNLDYLLAIDEQTIEQMYIADEEHWLTGFGVCAIGNGGNWQLFQYDHAAKKQIKRVLEVPDCWRVFGLYIDDNQPCFLVIHQDNRQVALFNPTTLDCTELYCSAVNIVTYSYCSLAKSMALVTEKGDVVLYSLLAEDVRLMLSQGVV